MEPSKLLTTLCISLVAIIMCHAFVLSQGEDSGLQMMSNAMDFPGSVSLYGGGLEDEEEDGESTMRSLLWYHTRYYISYGALSANRIPCPPRSGRSYYTHNCYKASGPAHPYTRGCSAITRCRR